MAIESRNKNFQSKGIIMGGSGSTGSSLLKNILNRNEAVFAGGETAFFAKKMVYKDWQKARGRVLKRKFRGLRNHGWHIYNGTDLLQREYLWEASALQEALHKSKDLHSFTRVFYDKAMNLKGARLWLEKTPANAACFRFFLDAFPEGKVIHIVRNPYDTIASLVNRGYGLYYAVGIYLLNTASGLSVKDDPRVHTVKYEELTTSPEPTVRELCTFLGITYSPQMLEPQGETVEKPKLEGWNYDETKAIRSGSVGRFGTMSVDLQDQIMEAVSLMHVTEYGQGYYELNHMTIDQICQELHYEFYPIGKVVHYADLRKQQLRDRIERVRRGYPTGFYYPLEIRN